VGLNNAKSAVVHHSSRFHWALFRGLTTEPKIAFALVTRLRIRSMNGILGSFTTKLGADRAGSGLSCCFTVGRTNNFTPLRDGIGGDKFETNAHIRAHLSDETVVEGLTLVFGVESTGGSSRELAHLKLGDFKAGCVNIVHDLTDVLVTVGLDHTKSTATEGFEVLASKNVSVVSYFHAAR